MGMYDGRYSMHADSAHEAAVQYVRECLRPMNETEVYWTLTYARNDPIWGLRELKTPTIYKVVGIIQSIAFSQKNMENGRHGRDRFIPDICAGKYRTKTQRKAAIDSVYHFLYLVKDKKKVDAGVLHDMLRGLPCNKKNFVNCSLPVRRAQVEALLKFMIASVEDPYRDSYERRPRGLSVQFDGTVIINSPELIDLLWRRHEDADRIITMFVDEGAELGVIEDRLNTHTALDIGVL